MLTWTEKTVAVSELKPYAKNPRKISKEAYARLKASIAELGYHQRIVAQPDGLVIGGHSRIKCLKELGIEQVTILIPSRELTEAEYRRMLIQDNLPFGEFDQTMLATDFTLPELEEWGMPSDWLPANSPASGLTDPDATPTAPPHPITLYGDLFLLGDHRLLCGDSTKAEDVAKLMDGQKADMVFTDPPYGMNLDTDYTSIKGKIKKASMEGYHPHKYEKIIGDDKEFDASFLLQFFNYVTEQFWWGADYYCKTILINGSWIVWDKTGGHDSLINAGFGSNFELCWSKKKHKRDIARITYKGMAGHNDGKRTHPTMKPIALFCWFFEKWGKKGDIIVDPFSGSGTTIIAAEMTGRKCLAMEIAPQYVDLAVIRWQNFTGKSATHAETGETFNSMAQRRGADIPLPSPQKASAGRPRTGKRPERNATRPPCRAAAGD